MAFSDYILKGSGAAPAKAAAPPAGGQIRMSDFASTDLIKSTRSPNTPSVNSAVDRAMATTGVRPIGSGPSLKKTEEATQKSFADSISDIYTTYRDQSVRLAANISTGVLGASAAFMDGVSWATRPKEVPEGRGAKALSVIAGGNKDLSKGSAATARQLDAWGQELQRDRIDSGKLNPTFMDSLQQGAGSSLPFFVPGLAIMRGSQLLAKVSPTVAGIFGGSASAALESMAEAGTVYHEAQKAGRSEQEAADAATATFAGNAIVTTVLNNIGPFGGSQRKFLMQTLMSAPVEGIQEGLQQVIQNLALGRPADEGLEESVLVGAIVGAGMGASEVVTRPSPAPGLIRPNEDQVGAGEDPEDPGGGQFVPRTSYPPAVEQSLKEDVADALNGDFTPTEVAFELQTRMGMGREDAMSFIQEVAVEAGVPLADVADPTPNTPVSQADLDASIKEALAAVKDSEEKPIEVPDTRKVEEKEPVARETESKKKDDEDLDLPEALRPLAKEARLEETSEGFVSGFNESSYMQRSTNPAVRQARDDSAEYARLFQGGAKRTVLVKAQKKAEASNAAARSEYKRANAALKKAKEHFVANPKEGGTWAEVYDRMKKRDADKKAKSVSRETKEKTGTKRTREAFERSKEHEEVGQVGDAKVVIGSYGKGAVARKEEAGKEDRLPLSELSETLKHVTKDIYRSGNSGFRKDNAVMIAKMPNGEIRAVVTRQNAAGQEEVINFFKVGRDPEQFIANLSTFGTLERTRTSTLAGRNGALIPLSFESTPTLADFVRIINEAKSEEDFVSTLKANNEWNAENPEGPHRLGMTDFEALVQEDQEAVAKAFVMEDDLTTHVIEALMGRDTVSAQFISDLSNKPELKQAERDLVRDVLAEYGTDLKVEVKVNDFSDKLRAQLLPLQAQHREVGSSGWSSNISMWEHVVLPDNLRGDINSYFERVYSSPIKTSAGADHHFSRYTDSYFAHSRVEDIPHNGLDEELYGDNPDGDIRRVIEIQSDLFQKGRLDGEFDPKKASGFDGADTFDSRIAREKEIEKLEPYRNTWWERIIREEVRIAAQDEKTKLRFPVGETAMKIEGLGVENNWRELYEDTDTPSGPRPSGSTKLKPENLSVGMRVYDGSEQWIVTDVLGDGKFKAVTVESGDYLEQGGKVVQAGYDENGDEFDAEVDESSKETFDISGKLDTSNPIYRFYEKDVARYVAKKYDAKRITDEQGVEWMEVEVDPDLAYEPIMAFKRFGGADFDISPEQAEARFRELFTPEEIGFVLTDQVIENMENGKAMKALGLFTKTRRPWSPKARSLVQVLQRGGKVSNHVLYHEAFHGYFNNFVADEDRVAALNEARGKLSQGASDTAAEEWLADDFARYVADKESAKPLAKMYRKIVDTINGWMRNMDALHALYEDVLAGRRPGISSRVNVAAAFEAKDAEEAARQFYREQRASTPAGREEARKKPVETEGEKKASRAFERVKERLGIEESESYNRLDLARDTAAAIKFVEDNPVAAKRIALGLETAPEGLTETAISIAYAEKAAAQGDFQNAADAERSRSLRQTRRGQEIVAERGRFTENAPAIFIRQVLRDRLEMIGHANRHFIAGARGKTLKDAAVEVIDAEKSNIKKRLKDKQMRIKDAQTLLDRLTCP